AFASDEVVSKRHALRSSLRACSKLKGERRAGVEVPGLGGVDTMPMGALATRQQKIDCGRGRAPVYAQRIAKRLPEMAALRMRGKCQETDHVRSGKSVQNRFFRSRISAKTFQAGLPASPTAAATSGRSARRNGLAAFSSPRVEGTVGAR